MKPLSSNSSSEQEISCQFDIIVVGSGAAGLYATLCLPEHFQVGLVTKDTLKIGASDWAQGGIAAAIDPKDSPKLPSLPVPNLGRPSTPADGLRSVCR